MQIQVTNASTEQLDNLSLRLMKLTFPRVPEGATLEAGMFGGGFRGTPHPLYQYPLVADPEFVVPIVLVDYGSNALIFCSDDLECSVGISYTTNPLTGTSYPLVMTCPKLNGIPDFQCFTAFRSSGRFCARLGRCYRWLPKEISVPVNWTIAVHRQDFGQFPLLRPNQSAADHEPANPTSPPTKGGYRTACSSWRITPSRCLRRRTHRG